MEYKFTTKHGYNGAYISIKDIQSTSASMSELDMATLISIIDRYSENNFSVLDNILKAIDSYISFYENKIIQISNNRKQQTFKQYSMKTKYFYKDVYGNLPSQYELDMFLKLLCELETLTLRVEKEESKEPTKIKMISIQAYDNENIIFSAPYFEYCYYKILQEERSK